VNLAVVDANASATSGNLSNGEYEGAGIGTWFTTAGRNSTIATLSIEVGNVFATGGFGGAGIGTRGWGPDSDSTIVSLLIEDGD
jgi:hypothetical protein